LGVFGSLLALSWKSWKKARQIYKFSTSEEDFSFNGYLFLFLMMEISRPIWLMDLGLELKSM